MKLARAGLLPMSRPARITWFLLGIDLLLFALETILGWLGISYGRSLGGWVTFLSFIVIVLLLVLGYRYTKAKLLWRLRNRLIVTYMFIGVIPSILLAALAFITLYLFAGQFANFVVTSELHSRLESLEAVNSAIASEMASRITRRAVATPESVPGLKENDPTWATRDVCAWEDGRKLSLCSGANSFSLNPSVPADFVGMVRDGDQLYLRASKTLKAAGHNLTVISSEPLDRVLLSKLAASIGEITLYGAGFEVDTSPNPAPAAGSAHPETGQLAEKTPPATPPASSNQSGLGLHSTLMAGSLPLPSGRFDRVITFGTPLLVTDWRTGQPGPTAALRVQTRPSILYARLFAALGDFAKSVQYVLITIAVFFAIIELLALFIGTRLTRTVTRAVAQLYVATHHINRGDFSHRIPVKSDDQLSTLANSFNSMAASLEQLIEEQKQKQRLENELVIAQEVQNQLFPREDYQLPALEAHGFCRPARTVSGDYYDFLCLDSSKLILAMGDVSGKGISAALLMATIHSAVRAYSLEGIPVLREPLVVGAIAGADRMLSSHLQGVETSPGTMLSLLNHQLFASTPAEKYATLFLGVYDAQARHLTYSNGGHLPPIILAEDGSVRRLDQGGTVVGLFDNMSYDEGSVHLGRGEIFVAYSDGITEPENDFGEFGEQRLIELVWENRQLPLPRISEMVTAAVDDWIGANEQPDDITLVLARAR